jgi:predicted RNase H-like HicB family nuclease
MRQRAYTESVKQRVSKHNPAELPETHPLAELDFLSVDLAWDEGTQNWVTHVRELDLSDFGKTRHQALDRTQELVLSWLDEMQALGLRVPLRPAQIEKLRAVLA